MSEHNHIGYFPLASICQDNGKPLGELVDFKNASTAGEISPLSQVNFFIGGNNAGKSRMLRGLFHTIRKGEAFSVNFVSSKKAATFNFFARKYEVEQAFYKRFPTAIQNPIWEELRDLEAYFKTLFTPQYNIIEAEEKINALQDILKNYTQKIEHNSSESQIGITNYAEYYNYVEKLYLFAISYYNHHRYNNFGYDYNRYNKFCNIIYNNLNLLNEVEEYSLLYQIQEPFRNALNKLKSSESPISHDWIWSEESTQFSQQITTLYETLQSIPPQVRLVFADGKYSIKECKSALNQLIEDATAFHLTTPRLYIPVLRSMRTLGDKDYYVTKDNLDKKSFQMQTMQDIRRINEHDFYKLCIEKDYKIESNKIFAGLSIYEDFRAALLGAREQHELVREFVKLLSKEFFDGESITFISRIDTDVVYVRIGEKEEMPIYNLGDEIQAIFILIFPLFMRKKTPTMVFIEEPEMHLHPKFQRVFMDILRREFPMHQFFITTHSNVFINQPDASIFRVWQEATNERICLEYLGGDKMELLAELGYKPSDVLQPNYLLWVEGESDKYYMKLFIETLAPDLCEGEHYHIVSYGGCSNLKHIPLEQLISLNPNFGLVVDSDKKTSTDEPHKNRAELCENISTADKFAWVTERREIENYFSLVDFKKSVAIAHKLPIERIQLEADNSTDLQFADFCKYKDTNRPNELAKIDKILVAKEIYKQLKGKFSLETNIELREKIEKLVEAIRAANQINESPTI